MRRYWREAAGILGAALLITAVTWPLSTTAFDALAQRRLDSHTTHLAADLERTLATSIAAVAGVGTGLVAELPGLDPAVFDARLDLLAATGLLDTVTSVSLVQPAAADDLEEAQAGWHPSVRDRIDPPTGPGPEHLLITHLWPPDRPPAAVGIDITSIPEHREAARHAMDQGRITSSDPFVLLQDPDERTSAVTYLPLTGDTGRSVGLLGVAVRHQALLDSVGRALPGVEDQLVHVPTGTVVASLGTDDAGGRLTAATEFDLYGQHWQLRAAGDPRPPGSIARIAPWLLPTVTGLAGAALFGLVLARRSTRLAEALAEERTRELRAADAELRRANAELAATSAVKDEVLAAVSHDVRAPLTVIGGLARTLLYRPAEPALVADAVGRIAHQVDRLEALVGDLLITAAGRDPGPDDRRRVDLDALTRRVVDDLGIGTVVSPQVEAPVQVTPLDVERILENLLNNAARHGDPPVDVEVTRHRDHVELAVRDHGPGIDPEHGTEIFDPFHQVGRRREGGIGLGLTIALRLARANGGDLRHERPPGTGARFVLFLPLAAGPDGAAPTTTPAAAPTTTPAPAPTTTPARTPVTTEPSPPGQSTQPEPSVDR